MRALLISAFLSVLISSECLGGTDAANKDDRFTSKSSGTESVKSSDDYTVNQGGTYHSGGTPPPKKCEQVCTTKYYDCAVDCFRGRILVLGGCLGKCSMEDCKTVCE